MIPEVVVILVFLNVRENNTFASLFRPFLGCEVLDELNICLVDPLTKRRIRKPAIGVNCSCLPHHIFDEESWKRLYAKVNGPKKCPRCNDTIQVNNYH